MSQVEPSAGARQKVSTPSAAPAVEVAAPGYLPSMTHHNIATPPPITPQNVAYLQRTIGNVAVQHLLAPKRPTPSIPMATRTNHAPPLAQRKFADDATVDDAGGRHERVAGTFSKQVAQRTVADRIQRIYQHPDNNKYYSNVLDKQEITEASGVITASATGGPGGGHTILVFEYLDPTGPHNMKVDLTAGGGNMSSGSGSGNSGPEALRSTTGGSAMTDSVVSGSTSSQSSTTGAIQINMSEASPKSLTKLASAQKRSWVATKEQITKGLEEAVKVQSDMQRNVGKYSYKLFGRSIFAKNPMNCASFGERVLQKAGIRASATSWWFGTKLPSTLASGANEGYKPDTSFPVPKPIAPPTPVTAPVTPPVAAPVQDGRRGADPSQFDHIKQLAFRNVTFLDGKIIAGDINEFDYKGTPNMLFTFSDTPTTESQLPLTMFKITVHKDIGLARLEPPVGNGNVRFAYVLLSDLFTSAGTIATA